jgi:type 1 glutamine amidotransferase
MKTNTRKTRVHQILCVAAVAAAFVGCASEPKPAAVTPKHVLVVSTTAGFRHSSIPIAEQTIATLSQSNGAFTVEFARVDPSEPQFAGADGKPDKAKVNAAIKTVLAEKMSPAALKRYDAIIFANTTGDLPLPDPQAFLDWIKSGKGFIGMHAATDTFPGFKPYTEMIGGHFLKHGAQVEVDVINQDKECPSCRHLGDTWTVFDEIYIMKDFDRTKVHGLLTLNQHPNDRTPGDYPIAWRKDYGAGRVFYTSLGHREDIWDAEWKDKNGVRKNSPEVARQYQQHILGGIRWALGLEK